jgi:hypothetical protein
MKNERITAKIEKKFLRTLPEVGTKEHDRMMENAKSLTTTNCGWIEYQLAQLLKEMFLPVKT